MKWAALFRDVARFVIFEGGSSTYYPDWFVEFIENNTYEDEYRYTMLYPSTIQPSSGTYRESYHNDASFRTWPEQLTEGQDVFLQNYEGEVYRINIEDFDKYYHEVAYGVAALKSDCIEFIHYTNDYDIFPDWFVSEVLRGGKFSVSDGLIYADLDGEGHLFNSGQVVFLRNKVGDIRTVGIHDFNRTYVWWQNYRLSEYDLI